MDRGDQWKTAPRAWVMKYNLSSARLLAMRWSMLKHVEAWSKLGQPPSARPTSDRSRTEKNCLALSCIVLQSCILGAWTRPNQIENIQQPACTGTALSLGWKHAHPITAALMAGHSCEGMIAVSSCWRHSRISIISCAQNPHTTRPPRARSSFGMNDFRSPGKCKTSLQDQELAASTATGNYSLFQMILDNALPQKMPWSSVPLFGPDCFSFASSFAPAASDCSTSRSTRTSTVHSKYFCIILHSSTLQITSNNKGSPHKIYQNLEVPRSLYVLITDPKEGPDTRTTSGSNRLPNRPQENISNASNRYRVS